MGLVVFGLIIFVLSFVLGGLHKQTSDSFNLRPSAWFARVVGLLMVAGGILWGTVTIVPAGYRGVLLRFGAVAGQLPEGINFVIPGVNQVQLVDVRTQKEESEASAASKDLQVVTTRLALNFRVDPEQVGTLYKTVGSAYKSILIEPAVQESLKVVTAGYTAEELIRSRATAKSAVQEEITKRLANYHILVEPGGLSITNFDFSAEFNKAIEAKQVAQQQAEQQKYVLQRAELEKETAIKQAEGLAQAAKLNAAALQVQGGELVIAREWIDKWDGKLPSVYGTTGNGGMMFDLSKVVSLKK